MQILIKPVYVDITIFRFLFLAQHIVFCSSRFGQK